MHLKRLEAYGFKSFADRLCLNFNDGVTCIVGPNGCGKSNVSDAIRWVLGEQRAQDLRTGKGNKMDQVIFKGTSSRKPMGYCEVTLVFDNQDRTLNLDSDEVIITRKMYRTGESEYYINKQRDKLKNLINLFRDTGIGKDGYSVIGQGKIDSFLTAKPEDRRQIFEEAAGISKYKANRKEAINSLEKTQANLDLVIERLHGYEGRIVPLEKQALVAIKASELKNRIKDLDVNHFLFMTENSEEKSRELSQKVASANELLIKANLEKEKTDIEYNEATQRVSELEIESKALYQKMLDLTNSAANKNTEQQKLQVELKNVESIIKDKTAEIEEKKKIVEANTVTRSNYIRENQEVTLAYMKAKADEDRLVKEYEEADAILNERREKMEIMRGVFVDSIKKWGHLNGDVAKLETERLSLEKSLEKDAEALDLKKIELQEIKKKLKIEEENVDRLEKEKAEKKVIRDKLDVEFNQKITYKKEIEEKLAEIRDSITQKKAWIQYQENGKANYAGYDVAVKTLMNSGYPEVTQKIRGVVGDVISVSPKYALAIEIALGGNISNIITNNHADTAFLIDFLKKCAGGRGTFLPLDSMRPKPLELVFDDILEEDGCVGIASDLIKVDREYRLAIENLIGRVVVVDTMDTAIKLSRKYNSTVRIVTLTGENYAIGGAVTGGKTRNQGSHVLSLEADIAKYKKQLEELEHSKNLLNEELITVNNELKNMESTDSVLNSIIAKLDKEITASEQRNQYVIFDRAKLEAEIEKINDNVTQTKAEILTKNVMLENEKKKIDSQDSEQSGTDDLIGKMADEVKELEVNRAEANERRTRIITTVKNLEVRSKELVAGISTLEKEIARLNTEILNATALINIKQSESTKLNKEIERVVMENTDNEELQKVKAQRDELDKEKVDLSVKQTNLYNERQKSADKVSSVMEQKARAETMLENLKKEIESATERVREDYGLDYDGALEYKFDNYDDHAGQQEVKTLRKELIKLGDVNEMAINDLAELKKEYDELKVHYDDVVKARDMLNETISDLTKKMETIFSESFEKIKANFAIVFAELFDGGKGKLDLDIEYGKSILDAGIIIEAEPPGKKLQNIDLLSGGERALTAIAIIFAIIKLNPVPFCILDEVDAPLDESNSVVYAKFLRKFSKNTQFVIVSHRKPTMELANELYGITMQEKGVSKLFSVKLSEALKIAEKAVEGN